MEGFERAGYIAKKTKKQLSKIINPNVSLLKIAKFIESQASPAFPCNLCLNNVVSFYTPNKCEKTSITEDDLLKIDFGFKVHDCPVDTAITVSFSHRELIDACKEALDKALEIIKPGVEIREISAKIQEVIENYGFKTFEGIHGHGISKGTLHSFLDIPNVRNESREKIKKGQILAIEVFASDGKGKLTAIKEARIYKFIKPVEKSTLFDKYRYYPFTERWINNLEREEVARYIKLGKLYPYPILVEKSGARVAQFEETIVVTRRGHRILT